MWNYNTVESVKRHTDYKPNTAEHARKHETQFAAAKPNVEVFIFNNDCKLHH